jgi:membrane fusion protein, multidrug efflux system
MSGRAKWVLVAAMVLAIAVGAYRLQHKDAKLPDASQPARAATQAAEHAAFVEASPVSTGTVVEKIRAVGTLLPNESVIISPEIAGRVAELPFKEGDKVEAGETLVQLDSDILSAELAKAQSDLTLAEANRKRAMTLANQGTGTLRARDEAVAAYQSAVANVALAQARLEKAAIAAPFSGVVGMRAISAGAYVSPGDRIVQLAAVDPIKVEFRVPELALPSLRAGEKIEITVDALPGRTFDGKIYVIDPIVDANGRAIRLRARIPNPDGQLTPGLFARVEIILGRRDNAVLVPESAIFADGQKHYVYRIVDDHAVQTQVTLGKRRPGQVEVRTGLSPDAVVVTAGHGKIRDGSRVAIVKPHTGA